MQNVMMIDNMSYALWECPGPLFMLKSDIEETLKKGEHIMVVKPKLAMRFNGKFYGYKRINPPEKDETVLQTNNGDSGQ